jgi:hypothetical protein
MKSPEKSPDKSLLISVQAAHSPGVTEGAGGEVLMCWAVVEMGRFDMCFLPLEMGNLQGIVSGFFLDLAHISIDLSGKHIKQMGIGRRFSWHLIFMGSFQAVTTGVFPIFF